MAKKQPPENGYAKKLASSSLPHLICNSDDEALINTNNNYTKYCIAEISEGLKFRESIKNKM